MIVRVPGSSANLGPGFDALGMALGLEVEMGVGEGLLASTPPDGARALGDGHPGLIAFREAGGVGSLWERSSLPMGRGLGFSGAVRVGGALLAEAQRADGDIDRVADRRNEVMALVARLEGHPDNVAASLYGGVVATAAERVVQIPLAEFDKATSSQVQSVVSAVCGTLWGNGSYATGKTDMQIEVLRLS